MAEVHETFGGRRHADALTDPEEQRFAQLLFEEDDLPADGRLRDVQLSSARAERAGLGDALKNLELAKVHVVLSRAVQALTAIARVQVASSGPGIGSWLARRADRYTLVDACVGESAGHSGVRGTGIARGGRLRNVRAIVADRRCRCSSAPSPGTLTNAGCRQ